MTGVLVVDKPTGITSHDVVSRVRRVLRERQIGHTGTLDPLATGVLPLACGQATRLVRFLLSSAKDYEATITFGLTTDTYDVTGQAISRSGLAPTAAAVEAALVTLRGEYLQTPPAYSAKKVAGRRAYSLARQDAPVTLAPVPVRVTRADLLELAGTEARIVISCSAGFYVRSFAHVLGERAGTGACLSALRRTRSGDFGEGMAVTLDVVEREPAAARLIPLEHLLPAMPAVRLTGEGRARVSHGREVAPSHLQGPPGLAPPSGDEPAVPGGDWVRLFDEAGALVALARPGTSRGSLHPAVVLI